MQLLKFFSLTLLLPLLLIVPIESKALGIVTASSTGTYIKIGNDISELVKEKGGIKLDVHPSGGSLDNAHLLHKDKKAQIAIVQQDVLAYLKGSDSDILRDMSNKFKMLFPLYNEEIHILARKEINSLSELNGKTVAFGGEGSGSFLTATVFFDLAGLNVKPDFVGGKDALDKLKKGEVDAMIYVAGFPVTLFEENVSLSDNLHLLDISDKNVKELYNVESNIPSGTYPFMEHDVQTVAVKAVLMTFNYRGSNCPKVAKIGKTIFDNMDWLTTNGHSKWKQVDLDQKISGWEQYSCLLEQLGKSVASSGTNTSKKSNPITDAIMKQMGQ